MTEATQNETLPVVCEKHGTETGLRCNRCGKPICGKCAIRTAIGYRCEECIKGQQKVFDTSETQDIFLAPAIAGILAFIGGLIVPRFGFWSIFIAPVAGTIIAEVIRKVINRRRSKEVFKAATIALVIGGLLPALWPLILNVFLGGGLIQGLLFSGFRLLWQGVYVALAASTAYTQLSGIRLGKR